MADEIDIVYLWVDGNDPDFRNKLKQASNATAMQLPAESVGGQRFRSLDELRYSLRSVAEGAGWVRKIHLLTNGQKPAWLNTAHEKIALVTHEQIFPDPSHLPTFNSNAIEMHLHRIPGLAEKFIYFNDDLFLGRPLTRGDYILPNGGQKYYFERIKLHQDRLQGKTHDRAYAHTFEIISRRWPDQHHWLPAHCPQLYQRSILAELADLFAEECAATSGHRFRMPDDWVMRIAYSGFLFGLAARQTFHQEELLGYGTRDYSLICLEDNVRKMVRAFLHVLVARPRFFCVNDDLDDLKTHRVIELLAKCFFRLAFPNKCRFER